MEQTGKPTHDPLDLIEKAHKNDIIQVDIDLGGVVTVLTLADANEMFKEQKKAYRDRYDFYKKEKGYDAEKVDGKEWNRYLKIFEKDEDRKRVEGEKPKNLAEQLADSDTRTVMLEKLIPKYLRNKTDGKLICDSDERLNRMSRLLMSTPKLQNLIIQKITELTGKLGEVKEQAKNS